jgi:hypothetical protein
MVEFAAQKLVHLFAPGDSSNFQAAINPHRWFYHHHYDGCGQKQIKTAGQIFLNSIFRSAPKVKISRITFNWDSHHCTNQKHI